MVTQFKYFIEDLKRMLGKHKSRILYIWLSRIFLGIFMYRLDRGLSMIFGKTYTFFRLPLIPLFNLTQIISNIDINYKANIQGGLLILHTSPGIVISGYANIGKNLTLTGGNVIGGKPGVNYTNYIIGNNCSLGANAVILGPLILGNNINIGASACVTKSFETDNLILIGVPAKIIDKQNK